MKQLLSLLVLLLGLSTIAEARLFQGADVGDGRIEAPTSAAPVDGASPSLWGAMKTKVQTWWSNFRKEPAPNQSTIADRTSPSTSDRSPASATGGAPVGVSQQTRSEWTAAAQAQLPSYRAADGRLSVEKAGEIKNRLSSQKAFQTERPARPAMKDLPKNAAGVPVFSFKGPGRVKALPLLDIGTEEKVQARDWQVDEFRIPRTKFESPKRLRGPELISSQDLTQFLGAAPGAVPPAQKIILAALSQDQKVTPEMVAKLIAVIGSESPVSEKSYVPMSPEDMKFLRAIILYAQKDKCHFAVGLFSELTKSDREEIRIPSDFYQGICLHQMGLFSESIDRLLNVIESGSKEFAPTAMETLLRDVPYDHEIRVAGRLLKVQDKSLIPASVQPLYDYVIAKGTSRSGKYELSLQHALKVDIKDRHYANAQFIAAVAEYALEKPDAAVERNKKLLAWIELNGNDKYLKTLVAHNLARFYFQTKNYKEAMKFYAMISKDHPLWMDALIEQGWAQLALDDSAGAIGNMYSMHSPFFKLVFKPESFVVRTIGYLNICQYGDAYRTLSRFENEHRDLVTKVDRVQNTVTNPVAYYSAMVRFIEAKMAQDTDGFPGQVLREIGRQREYLNLVKAVNARFDEIGQYKFLQELRSKDDQKVRWLRKKAEERVAALKGNIKKAEANPALAAGLNQLRQTLQNEIGLIEFYKFNLEVFAEATRDSLALEKVAKASVEKKRKELIQKAGEFMMAHLKVLKKDLERMLANNEFLRYEVFAGSGENLRFEMAGGTAEQTKRVPASIRPRTAGLNWSFDGEYWEDEIGHYRSSLKNNCGT